jgi:hypothetical protein
MSYTLNIDNHTIKFFDFGAYLFCTKSYMEEGEGFTSFTSFVELFYHQQHPDKIMSITHNPANVTNLETPVIISNINGDVEGITLQNTSLNLESSSIQINDGYGNSSVVLYDVNTKVFYTWDHNGNYISIELNNNEELEEENNELKEEIEELKEKNKELEDYSRFDILDLKE